MTRFQYVAMLGVVVIATALCSWGQFAISVSFGPPLLPVYAQPLCPAPGYVWTPGYWAWDPNDGAYYWVPGTWVLPPTVGLLWTPGYWGFVNGAYGWYDGYWGPTVGFYGGINYGFGYPGNGYYGGEWRGREFYYNRTVNNVNVTNITNVYNQTVPNNINRVAYNNGPNGVQAQPTQQQIAARQQHHDPPTAAQTEHQQAARKDPAQFASANGGNPAVVATPTPGALNDPQAKRAALPPAPTPPGNAANKPETENNQHARGQQNVPRPTAADEQATHTPAKKAAAPRQAEPPQQQAPTPRMQQPQPQKEQPKKPQQPPQ